ncbi:hypothetical protein ACSU6B_23090 [Neobacillus sp. C211]|uniref:hypothetical protein n=1 Tax=unclassified Neobacillus TaxID=2675272 RepID=UPI0039786F75
MNLKMYKGEKKLEFIYQVVTTTGASYFDSLDDYMINEWNNNPRQREELQDQPKLDGLIGPMFNGNKDGKVCIRYETYEAYRMYSA